MKILKILTPLILSLLVIFHYYNKRTSITDQMMSEILYSFEIKDNVVVESQDNSYSFIDTIINSPSKLFSKFKRSKRPIRKFINSNQTSIDIKNLELVNTYNDNWKNILGRDLLRFQKENTKVIIQHKSSNMKLESKDKAKLVEQVLIVYKLPNGEETSYMAYIDSSTGRKVQTWDRRGHIHYEKIKFNFTL